MTWKSLLAVALVGGACVAWWTTSRTTGLGLSGPRSVASAAPRLSEGEARLAAQVERLHGRLSPDGTPRGAGRNPFSFGVRPVAATQPPSAPPPPRPALVEGGPRMAQPAAPPFRLAGIAEDTKGGTPTRTAILSTSTGVVLAHEGDLLPPRYRVTKISADVVEINEMGTTSTTRLVLK